MKQESSNLRGLVPSTEKLEGNPGYQAGLAWLKSRFLSHLSLAAVENFYRHGHVSQEEWEVYSDTWDASPVVRFSVPDYRREAAEKRLVERFLSPEVDNG